VAKLLNGSDGLVKRLLRSKMVGTVNTRQQDMSEPADLTIDKVPTSFKTFSRFEPLKISVSLTRGLPLKLSAETRQNRSSAAAL
jgi:hypothetical protein